MRKITKITTWFFIFLFFAASSIAFYVFNSNIWKNVVKDFIEIQISGRSDLVMDIDEISGTPIVGNLKVRNIRLMTPKGFEIVNISELSLHYGLIQFLINRGEVRSLEVSGVTVHYPASLDSLTTYLHESGEGGIKTRLAFKKCTFTDIAILDSSPDAEPIIFSNIITASIALSPDSSMFLIKKADCQIQFINEKLTFFNTDLTLVSDSLFLRKSTLSNRSTDVGLSGFARLGSPIFMNVDYNIENFIFSERLSGFDSILAEDDYLNFRGNLELSGDTVNIASVFYGQIIDNIISDSFIKGCYRFGSFDFDQLTIRSQQQLIDGSFSGSLNNGANANLNIRNINLNLWNGLPVNTSINGQMQIESRGKLASPDTLFARIALKDMQIDTLTVDSLKGRFQYNDGILAIIDTIAIDYKNTKLNIDGFCDLNTNHVNARAGILCDNVNIVSEFVDIGAVEGRLEGFLEAGGQLKSPDFRGWIRGINIGDSNIYFEDIIARFGFLNIQENRFGDIYVEATNGVAPFIKESIPLASLIVQFDKDTTIIRSFRITGEDMNIEVQGKMFEYTDLLFDRISVFQDGNYLNNIDPIRISLKEDTISLAEVRFTLNEGMIVLSGEAIDNRVQSAVININDLDIDPLNAYLKGARGVKGVVDGLVSYTDTSTTPAIYSRFDVSGVNIAGKAFNSIRLELRLQNDQMVLENIFVEDREKGYLNGFGRINCHYLNDDSSSFFKPSDSLSAQLQFENFDFGMLGSFIIPRRDKDGKMSGILRISNTLGTPVLNYEINIAEPEFDRLSGEQIKITGEYRDEKLNFSDLQYLDRYGLTKGSGFLPYSISFNPVKAVFHKDSLMDLSFTMHTGAVEFLASYINSVESIEGEYDMALNITGTPNEPVRSGNVTVKNGIIRLTSLENPVTGLTGSAILGDNMMEIISMEGHMVRPVSKRRVDTFRQKLRKYTLDILFPPSKPPEEPNVVINGTIDFTTFFRPSLNITMTGDELYIRTLLAEQEGILDGTFTVTGSDTMNIEGDVDINEFIIRNEFGGSESLIEEERRTPRVYTTINLHTIIPGNLYFRNSQLDCELEGEMWIIKDGLDPYRFSGTLDIRKGKFFYYGWQFDVVQGSITFDPTEFNPILDIEAQVDLASYTGSKTTDETSAEEDYVTVRLSGDLQNPVLEFKSDKYNEGDILMFLTRTQLGTEDAFNQDRISSDAMNVFGMYFERQLEKSIGRISGLDEFELRTSGNLLSNQQPDQWSVSLGQKLAPNLYLKYERNLSLIEPTQLFGIEYRLSRNFSVTGEVEQDGSFRIKYLYKYRY